jgi:hypothetical protein
MPLIFSWSEVQTVQDAEQLFAVRLLQLFVTTLQTTVQVPVQGGITTAEAVCGTAARPANAASMARQALIPASRS